MTFPRGQYKNLKAGMELATDAAAPIQQGDKLGTVKVSWNNETVAEGDLVALQPVAEGGFFRRLLDRVILMFKS